MRHRSIECAHAHAAVLRTGDDTDTTQRAPTLRPHPLAALAVLGRGLVSPARHLAGPVLGRLRPASRVRPTPPVVAVLRLSLPRHHRVVAPLAPAPAVGGVSGARCGSEWGFCCQGHGVS